MNRFRVRIRARVRVRVRVRVKVRVRVRVRLGTAYVLIDLSMTAIFTATDPAVLRPG